MKLQLEELALKVAKNIWQEYQKANIHVDIKGDGSPVTPVDMMAHHKIVAGLQKISQDPILSEEDVIDFSTRKSWNRYWLVDPLDGTKGFIQRTGDFTVNIALIENQKPILAVISVPKTNDVYFAQQGKGAFKNSKPIFNKRQGPLEIGLSSKLHPGEEADWFASNNIEQIITANSSLKMCWLAEGIADVYPRFRPTMEWDTGAGEIILKEAGCDIVQLEDLSPMPHNQQDLTNPSFIAYRTSGSELIAKN